MKNSRLENIIKDKMSDFQPAVNTDELWDSLESFIPEQKKRKGFPFFLSGLVLFAISLGLFYLSMDKNETKVADNDSINQSKSITKNNSIASNSNHTNHSVKTIHSTNKVIANNDINHENNNIESDNNQISKLEKSQFEVSTTTNIKQEKLKQNTHKVNGFIIGKTRVENNEKKTNVKSLSPLSLLAENRINHKETVFFEDNIDNKLAHSESNNIINTNTNNIQGNTLDIRLLDALVLSPIDYPSFEPDLHEVTAYPMTLSSRNLYMTLGARLGVLNSKYLPGDEESSIYADKYNSFISPKPIYGLKLGVLYDLNDNWSIESGINVSSYVNQLHSKWEVTTENVNPITTSVLHAEQAYEAIGHQYLYTIDVPLLASYDVCNYGRWDLGVQAGLLFNISTITKGKIMDTDLRLVGMNKNTFSSRFGASYQFGLLFNYKLNRKLNISLNPHYIDRKIAYQHENILLNLSQSALQIDFGIQLNLNK